MAEFSGKIVSAFYANEAHDVVKVRWDDNGTLNVYHVLVDENNADFKALEAEGWNAEKLLDEMAEELRGQSQAFNSVIQEQAKALAKEMLGMNVLEEEKKRLEEEKTQLDSKVNEKEQILIGLDKEVKVKTNAVDTAFFQSLWEINENKEELFKFKLWALELDAVKNADKSVKSAIRKANRISQGMAILDDLI
jgi:small-conductance mechanosensitive channel